LDAGVHVFIGNKYMSYFRLWRNIFS